MTKLSSALLSIGLLASCVFATTANASIIQYQVALTGAQLGSGDPDGYGNASLFIDDQALTISWDIDVFNIVLPLTAGHIHSAPAGANGPVVVDFGGQLSGSNLFDADLANVLLNPSNYYVNLHNTVYPTGAIRGQLSSPVPPVTVPVPASLPLVLSGLGLVAWIRRRRAQ